MINKEIFKELKNKISKSNRQLYREIDKVRGQIGYEFTRETAAYVLAGRLKVEINKYLDKEQMSLVRRANQDKMIVYQDTPVKKKQKTKTTRLYRFKDSFEFKGDYISRTIMNEAREMSEIYPYFYVFENSVRNFIISILTKEFGKDWWNTLAVSNKIRTRVRSRIQNEETIPWHGKRGQHPIFYSDISDLITIIKNNEKLFREVLPNRPIEWLTGTIWIIEQSRNIVAHNNPLNPNDINRVKINLKDWIAVLNSIQI